ncbi:hypothetical protein HB860_12670 [Aeromonas sp. 3925]|uniref:hypothetical protein n=1 Tax=Aeromonas genomosp. paramedia TaxID=3086176 RepID=UPI001FFD7645|nr:hypothetical protein [Aeromonas genomosp. paramedia]MCK2084784.1 hypothetical protein [Aeromonas genomosp. paramedia]
MEPKNVIQRYMNLSKFLYLLQNSTLFLPKMSIFDDQLEGGLTATDYLNKSNEPGILELTMNFLPVYGESAEQREKRLNVNEFSKQKLDNAKFMTPFGEYLKSDTQTVFPKCREYLYVSCWHRSYFECSAMWLLYGAEKNSVCIFTSIEKLEQQIIHNELLDNLKLEDVNYIDHAKAQFGSNCLDPFLSKSLPFSFEKELRIVAFDSKTDLARVEQNEKAGVNIRIHSLPKLIDRVVVSPNSDSWFKDCIQKLCNEYGLGIEVEMSSLKRERNESFLGAMAQLQNIEL